MLYYVKLYQTISKSFNNVYPAPQKMGSSSLMYANSHTCVLPLNTTPATFSRVPCVIWELFRRMVYMYVPLYENVQCFPSFPLFFPFLLLERKAKNQIIWHQKLLSIITNYEKIMPTQSTSKIVAWNHLWFYLTLSINPFMLLCTTMYWKRELE